LKPGASNEVFYPRREAAEFIFMAEITIILPVNLMTEHLSAVLVYFLGFSLKGSG